MSDNLRTFLTKLRELVKEHNVEISSDSWDGSIWVDELSGRDRLHGARTFVNSTKGDLSVETLDELLKQ